MNTSISARSPTLASLAGALESGTTSASALADEALSRAADPSGEGERAFVKLYAHAAPAQASASDVLRKARVGQGPLAGIPVSIKDLFDVAGEPTPAGSRILRDAAPAARDAPVVARLKAAGAVLVGRTNMVEFAYGAIGLNAHYGTPRCPWDRASGRAPGGSSSGAAVSVTDGMAALAIGSDTGGSVRIPAALCGLTGFKPTARRVPTRGAFPLSWTLDSIGPLARSVGCCALADAVMAGEDPDALPEALPVALLRFAVPQRVVLDALDPEVARAFQAALSRLAAAGARLVELPMAEFAELADLNAKGGINGAEAWTIHRRWLEHSADLYDPHVRRRLERNGPQSAADYLGLVRTRADWIARVERSLAPFDAFLAPTVPMVAPPVAQVERDEGEFLRVNGALLRNTAIVNFLDGCALSVPCHEPGEAPVGLMIAGPAMSDRRVLGAGLAVEALLRGRG